MQQEKLVTQTQELIPSSGRYPAGYVRMNIIRKNTKEINAGDNTTFKEIYAGRILRTGKTFFLS
jgi:hypothetical protein